MTPPKHLLPVLFGRVTAIASDHSRLEEALLSLERLAASLDPIDVGAASKLEAARAESQRFLEALQRHFAAEEANSYFGVLMAEEPATCGTVVALCAEHAEMLTLLEGVVAACAPTGAAPRERAEQVARDIAELARRLRAHEQVESRLMQSFLGFGERGKG